MRDFLELKIVLAIIFSLLIPAQTIAGNIAHVFSYSGDFISIDLGTNKIVNRGSVADETIPRVYDVGLFGGHSIIIKSTYQVHSLDIDTFEKKNVLFEESLFYEQTKIAASHSGDKLYISWVPYSHMGDGDKFRRLTVFDKDFQSTTINNLSLGEMSELSIDDSKIYAYSLEKFEYKVSIIDTKTFEVVKELTTDTLSRGSIVANSVDNINRDKLLQGGRVTTNDGYKLGFFVYDIPNDKMSIPVVSGIKESDRCQLSPDNAMIICERMISMSRRDVKGSGEIDIYEVKSGSKKTTVVVEGGAGFDNQILGVSPDSKSLYYWSANKVHVIDLNGGKVVANVDMPQGFVFMVFPQQERFFAEPAH